jgi:hypothetical protein
VLGSRFNPKVYSHKNDIMKNTKPDLAYIVSSKCTLGIPFLRNNSIIIDTAIITIQVYQGVFENNPKRLVLNFAFINLRFSADVNSSAATASKANSTI